ncbi:hypothetical protein KIW84_063989 [Lathyrus oleraceus]|uniref:Uncharacterized protein n=2 Tax=Pisum sativum TaxID=3888 RepID=A0A9D5A5K0_PEA|nr:hypothetical protein KIW84_UN0697 [Pisum sativum]KAI5381479.1 hypothetical protein KIW84_UN0698 [Pisum sativum]KAI5398422.1 hypothetical protein KIW84_063989 [Pisum sativum]
MKKVRNLKKRLERPVELDKINNETRVQDVDWICSLSESEIDFMISLKLLITKRAERIGCKNLADRFDLKTIRAIAFVLMENLKTEVKETSLVPDTVKSTAFLDACNILKCSNVVSATIEELSKTVGADIQPILTSSTPTSKRKKRKVGSKELTRTGTRSPGIKTWMTVLTTRNCIAHSSLDAQTRQYFKSLQDAASG